MGWSSAKPIYNMFFLNPHTEMSLHVRTWNFVCAYHSCSAFSSTHCERRWATGLWLGSQAGFVFCSTGGVFSGLVDWIPDRRLLWVIFASSISSSRSYNRTTFFLFMLERCSIPLLLQERKAVFIDMGPIHDMFYTHMHTYILYYT